MSREARRAYEELREIVEQRGGEMRYERAGYQFGAWVITLEGRQRVLESTGQRSLPELDRLYVPRITKPTTWDDYSHELIPNAEQQLLELVGLGTSEISASSGIESGSKTTLVQSGSTTREWLETLRMGLPEYNYSESKYYAAFRTAPGETAFAYLNPAKRSIRLFVALVPSDDPVLRPSPSTSAWGRRFPAVYRIESAQNRFSSMVCS